MADRSGLGMTPPDWFKNVIPLEVFTRISSFLPRDSIGAMRLVSKEWERKVSGSFFRQIVLPFRHDVFGRTERYRQLSQIIGEDGSSLGFRILRGFGLHILKFAIAFEIDDQQVLHPPTKDRIEKHKTFWGTYTWPKPFYVVYDQRDTADGAANDYAQMLQIFQHLPKLEEFALSIDGGCGWLQCSEAPGRRPVDMKPHIFGPQQYNRTESSEAISDELTDLTIDDDDEEEEDDDDDDTDSVVPDNGEDVSNFTLSQDEWLIETAWAQRSLLNTVMDAFMSDLAQLSNLRILTIARIPTGILDGLARQEVWAQMPQLTSLSIQVIPDWRYIWTNLGCVKRDSPSASVSFFYHLLKDYIAPLKFIRKLSIGWVSGGENAQDLLARNEHLMPLPLEPRAGESITTTEIVEVLHLPFVEELTLSNGWVGPLTLVRFIKKTTCPNLREVVLDSVSLAAQFEPNLNPHIDIYESLKVPLTLQNTQDFWDSGDALYEISRFLIRAFRPGCWLDVLEAISPGETWADTRYRSDPTNFRPRYIISHSGLVKLEFRSCGYAGLPHFTGVQPNHTTINRRHWGGAMDAHRQTGLADSSELDKITMITYDRFLGTICQRCSRDEWQALKDIYKLEVHGPSTEDSLNPPTVEMGATNAQIDDFWKTVEEEDDDKANDRFSGILVKEE